MGYLSHIRGEEGEPPKGRGEDCPTHKQIRKLMSTTTYNGWTNYETWNVALWIGNDEFLYNLARNCEDYLEFVTLMWFDAKTPDGVGYANPKLNWDELNEMIQEL